MNDLISGSFIKKVGVKRQDDIESGSSSNLDKFFDDVEAVQEYMLNVTKLHKRLQVSNEESKIACNAKTMKDLRARMDSDVVQVLKTVKIIKNKLEALGKANTAHRKLPGCGPRSSTDRTRTSVVNGLGKKLKDMMNDFQRLRMKMTAEYKETVERRYFTITGERPDEQTVENLISSGESEIFLQKAIEEQGKGQILDTILEIQERHDSVKEIEKNLIELHQVFLDMAALVESQGHQLHTIESHVAHASSFVKTGTVKMENGKQGTTVNQGTENIDVESVMAENSCRKWACIAFSMPLLSTVSRSCQRLLLRTKNEIASFNMKDSKCKSVVAKRENQKDYSEHALT